MTDEEVEQLLLENGVDGAAFFTGDNYAPAIIGTTDDGRVVYDYDKMVAWMVERDKCTDLDAMEWIDYNTIRTIPYMGDQAPIIIYPLNN